MVNLLVFKEQATGAFAGQSGWHAAQAFLGELGGEGLWPELDRFGRYLICTFSHKSDIGRARRAMIQLGYLAA